MREMTGRVALVIGGTSGISRAACLEFARAGARVIVTGRDGGRGDEVVRTIRDEGGEAGFHPRTVVWLCSDAASYVTGHSRIVNGGLTAPYR